MSDPPSPPASSTTTQPPPKTRQRRPPKRTAPPPQDKLVLVFISASTIFACISLSPFLLGHFPELNDGFKSNIGRHEFHGIVLEDGENNEIGNSDELPLARGSSGLPLEQTPSLIGAKHGSIRCHDDDEINFDYLAYWNEPGPYDTQFTSPFASNDNSDDEKYVTFEPDRGGWNNIRMSMEIIFVFAAATGRTLVLPPDIPFYLLSQSENGRGSKHHGFADFIDLTSIKGLKIITMKEFLTIATNKRLLRIPHGTNGEKITKSAEYCYYHHKTDRPCDAINGFLNDVSYVPELQAARECLVFDAPSFHLRQKQPEVTNQELLDALPPTKKERIHNFCKSRTPIFYSDKLHSEPLIHFHSGDKFHRLLGHFYTFVHFTDAKLDNHYKRFVRDNLHYRQEIYCAAGKIVSLLEQEASMQATAAGRSVQGGTPGYSAMHIRRGDFQYKKQKLSAELWLNATIGILHPDEIVYVATDEKDRTFFEPLAKRYNLRFLDEFREEAGLDDLDPNYAGMIDSILASRGRVFFGTWLSTFTGYINRMRGYHGFPANTTYYGQLEHKFIMHKWIYQGNLLTAGEWPRGWVGIDGDNFVDGYL